MKVFKCWLMALLMVGCGLLPLTGAGDEAKHSEADYQVAYTLLEAMQVPEQLKQTLEGMVDMQMKSNPQMLPFRDVFDDFFAKYLSYEALKQGYADIYLDMFTVDELRKLTAIYRTPLGRKLASKTSELAIRGAELGQKAVLQHQAELQTALAKAISERQSEE